MSPVPGNTATFRRLAATAVAAAMSLSFAWQPAAALQLPGDPAIAMTIAAEGALLDLTNADRVSNGLAPLEFDPDTLVIARQRAASQINHPSLSHFNSAGALAFVDLMSTANLQYILAGENLARADDTDPAVMQHIETALMNSPLHRKNILEPHFTRVAIGAVVDGGQITLAEVYRD